MSTNMNLQETIRRVLKETKQKKVLHDYIVELGFRKTAKLMGLSYTELAKISKIKIDSELANLIIDDNLINGKLTDEYKGFKIQSNMDGVFYWDGEIKTGRFLDEYIEQITVVATPFFDGMKYTPVEIDWFSLLDKSRPIQKQVVVEIEGAGSYYKALEDKTSFDSVEELFKWYDEVYLPGVYNIIINELLPKVHQDVEDKMDEDMIF